MFHVTNSRYESWRRCPRAYNFQYVQGIRPRATSANLILGSAVHKGIEAVLRNQVDGLNRNALEEVHLSFDHDLRDKSIRTNSRYDIDGLRSMAIQMVKAFPLVWYKSGWLPLVDDEGEPFIERELVVEVSNTVTLTVHPDLIGMHKSGAIGVIDFKTAAAKHGEAFGHHSSQLTAYQYAIERIIGPVDHLGYLDFLKKKEPEIAPLALYPPRGEEVVRELLDEYHLMAESCAKQRFNRRPGMAFESPCNQCDLASYCTSGNTMDVILPKTTPKQIAIQTI